MKQSIIEAVKELLRVCVLAAIPVAIDGLSQGELNLRLIGITAAIAGLRFVDKLLHEMGKGKEEKTGEPSKLTHGLTRF